MRYVLLMNTISAGPVYAGVSGWQRKDIRAHTVFMKNFTQSLRIRRAKIPVKGRELS